MRNDTETLENQQQPVLTWYQRLGHWILDYQIKSSIRKVLKNRMAENKLIHQTQDGSICMDLSSDDFTWLIVATTCSSKNFFNYTDIFGYSFLGNRSLAEFALSERPTNHQSGKVSLAEQTYIINIILLLNSQNKIGKLNIPQLKYSLWQRIWNVY